MTVDNNLNEQVLAFLMALTAICSSLPSLSSFQYLKGIELKDIEGLGLWQRISQIEKAKEKYLEISM